MTNRSFGFLDYLPHSGWIRTPTHLAFEDWRRSGGNELVLLQNELRINPIASWLIHLVSTEVAVKLVFVIVVTPELETFAVRRKFLFLIEHHQLRCAPWLARLANVTPEFVIGFVVTPPDIIIAGRFGCDVLRHLDSRLLNPLRNGFAAGEDECAEYHIRGQQILSSASHCLNGHHVRSFAPGAIASSQRGGPAINFSCEMDCMAMTDPLRLSAPCSKLRFMRAACAKWGTSWNSIGSSWKSPACVIRSIQITILFTSSSMNRL